MEVLGLWTKLKITFWKIRIKKLIRPEFWPAWLFYAPIVPYIVYLTVRYKGFGTICAANPGIPLGGLIGESKEQILKSIDSEHVLKFLKVPRTESGLLKEFEFINRNTFKRKFEFPYILKPDAGQRGSGVKLIKSKDEILEYLKKNHVDLILQEYHPGPQEAGIFYYRFPKEEKGRILSITRKIFPILEGNGRDSLGKLILEHPRFQYQWKVFRKRHIREWEIVLPKGEKRRLAEAGNHCQGTLFTDGSYLITEELTQKIDQISRTFSGFYFGRYDIRYRSDEKLKMGKEFGIVELNGVTSESTNLYDPDFSLWEMYRILFKQWNLLFRIGSENRERGIPKTSLSEIIKTVIRFYVGNRKINDLSD